MIVNDTHRFAFVHIPKCAGTSIRNALSRHDQAHAQFYDKAVSDHPVLGPLDHAHIPLAILRDHFPHDFARLTAYRSFALIRDPVSRFPSSLHERFVQRDRIPLADRAPNDVAREVDKVMAELTRLPKGAPITDPALIHFSRQCDYVYLDGQQVIDAPRTVAEAGDMIDEISEIVGTPIRIARSKNNRYSYAVPGFGRLQTAVTRQIEAVVPRRIWEPAYVPVKKALRATGLIRPGGTRLSVFSNAAEIDAFIREFYAGDIALFRRLDDARRARVGTGKAI